MNTNTKRASIAGTSIVTLALISALAQADSVRYTDVQSLNTGIEEATAIALASVAGDIIEAELELEHKRPVWEIDIVNNANQTMGVEIDGQTGEILEIEASDDTAPSLDDIISLNKAIELVKAVENGELIEMELEEENGEIVWEIETVSLDNAEANYRVSGLTGEILSMNTD